MRIEHQLFKITLPVSESRLGLVRCRLEERFELLRFETGSHAPPAAARRRLDHYRQAYLHRFGIRGIRIRHDLGSGSDRHAITNRRCPGCRLVTHHPDHIRRRANKSDAGAVANVRETRVLRKKTVSRMDRIRSGDLGRRDDSIRLEVGFLARARSDADGLICELHVHRIHIRLGIHRHRFDIHLAARADDSQGDFSPIGYQDTFEHFRLNEWKQVRMGGWVRGVYLIRYSTSPYCTGFPSSATSAQMVPDFSALISFITFIASMMQSVWPSDTAEPTSTKSGASGAGLR